MASTSPLAELLAKASFHFSQNRPFIPMYIHLILSALFPIYTGAHASLSRPCSAAKPDKRSKKTGNSEDEDDDEEKIQKMEGMSNKDAIILPITAASVLGGLYWLIMKYGADVINLIMGWYFSGIGVYSVGKLINDGLNIVVSFVFPTYYARKGSIWKVLGSECKAIRLGDDQQAVGPPAPTHSSKPSLVQRGKITLWRVRSGLKQKYNVDAYIHNAVDLRTKLTIINLFSASFGIGTIIYVNTVSKPWFLTNLQGFAVSYSALQIMSPTTFATGSLILVSLFCYDIWAVFFTPLMVAVAKNLDQPIKLVFPRPEEPSSTPGEPPVRSYSMLGLGDIVLPGIMIGLALRFDLYLFYLKKQTKQQKTVIDSNGQSTTEEVTEKALYVPVTGHWGDRFWTSAFPSMSLPAQLCFSFPKPYFTASMIGYVVGMLTTLGVMSVFQHAQPALLYLVPGVLISLWGTALANGEVTEMWEFSEALTGEQLEEVTEGDKNEDTSQEKSPKGLFERLWQEIWSGSEQDQQTEPHPGEAGKLTSSIYSKTEQDKAGHGKEGKTDDLLFSFSIARYNANTTSSGKLDKAGFESSVSARLSRSPSLSESSGDTVLVSSADVDQNKDSDSSRRYRTRSTRKDDGDGGVAI